MTRLVPGISGGLLPSHYIANRLLADAMPLDRQRCDQLAARLSRWWTRVESTCGPATGMRGLFDAAAMPLAALLGFRATTVVFDRLAARVRLETRRGAPVACVLLPWADRQTAAWRLAVDTAHRYNADWCLVFAPPYLSLLPAANTGVRRSLDVTFPEALTGDGVARLVAIAHADAFDAAEGAAATRIDVIVRAAAIFQDRVRADLQDGVLAALTAILPVVTPLPKAVTSFDQALTLLYRILFLLFAESRGLLPVHHPIYGDTYAMKQLCRQALGAGGATGLWAGLAAITRLSRAGCRIDDLIVSPFNGRLFARSAAPTLERRQPARGPTRSSARRDAALQHALVALATRPTSGGREEICYADLGVEQLGAVYERVLDLDPDDLQAPDCRRRPRGPRAHSARRKQTGTFYTPQDLTEFVVRRTLAPLVEGRTADQILALRIVDPAMGSGAFLVAACRYLAGAYERALIDDGRCVGADIGPVERAGIRRQIAEQCLAGVDVNPVAVQLARLSLWLATLSEGKPLGFLDRKSTRLNSSHVSESRMPSSA